MIIARSTTGAGDHFILLGLSRANIERLQKFEPIEITTATHGSGVPAGWVIAIMFGETELDMKRQLEAAKLFDKDTMMTIDPRLEQQ